MRLHGCLAGLVIGLTLAAPTVAAAQVDPAVQSSLRFPGGEEGPTALRVGDVNGDGQDDLLMYQFAQVALGDFAARGVVYFGRLPRGGDATTTPGVERAPATADADFAAIAAVDDFNGDGRDDLVVETGTTRFRGGTVVYYGSPGTASPVRGPEILGAAELPTGAGDVDGDGLGDVVVRVGDRRFVVFGRASAAPVDPLALGDGGFEVLGVEEDAPIDRAGDVDGDGLDDVVVGGRVLLGRTETTPADPASPGASFLVADGPVIDAGPVGDVNGDGFDDVFVQQRANRVRVVLGRATPGTLSGFTVSSGTGDAGAGPAGDVDADGFDDVIAFRTVVFGRRHPSGLAAPTPGVKGFLLNPSRIDDEFLFARSPVVGVGDVTGDARDDLVVGGYLVSGGTGPAGDECTITGTPEEDLLVGTPGDDVICGLGGRDTIRGLDGNDHIEAGPGVDTVDAGPGDDVVAAGTGTDRASGGEGADRMAANEGTDVLRGGPGGDALSGGVTAATLYGEDGLDRLDGQQGADGLDGGDADDLLRGGPGNDGISGGDGVDQIEPEAGFDNVFGGGDGDNVLDEDGGVFSGGDGDDTIQAGGGELKGQLGDDFLQAFDRGFIIGGDGDDTILGGPLNEFAIAERQGLFGQRGDDVIVGGGGEDSVVGGPGDDRLADGGPDPRVGRDNDELLGGSGEDEVTGGLGQDVVNGGLGDDVLTAGPDGDDRLTAGGGDDQLDSRNGALDLVRCHVGFDTALVDPVDQVDADCEVRSP